MQVVDYVIKNWVAISAILLALVRVAESIAIVLPDKKKEKLNKIIEVVKEFFRFG